MRVLLLGTGVQPIPPPGYGGVERTIAEYAAALRHAGHEAEILNEVRQRRGIDEYWFALHLRKLLTGRSYDVAHASTPVVANRMAMLGRSYVYTTHSRHWFERAGARQGFGYWLERRAVHRASATVALTDRLARTITAATARRPPRRLEVIPIGVDTDRFRPGTDRMGTRALGVGVILPFKRWDVAAAALRGTGVSLTLAGPTPDPDYAARVVAAGESVRLLGEVDDATLTRLYQESDYLVHPSRVELLAGVVLQGLAAGLPVFGADAVAELIEEGVSGACSPPGAGDAEVAARISSGVRALLADPERRRRMSDAARQRALENFSWPRVVARHLALYESVMAGPVVSRR
ncbi:MAG TPA: glycosyltransferase family 4 protein [Thermoplasmata archaeon]|nr:glycosyltransferase family 4 protein [Thermoplasmata archaeon]